MVMKQLLEVFDILDDSAASGERMKDYLLSVNPAANIEVFPHWTERQHGCNPCSDSGKER